MRQIKVTTSWDDGHVLDLRLAALLKKYGIAGTFYIAPENHEIEMASRLSAEEIRLLSTNFEIGAHTITHPRLTKINNKIASYEIAGSKQQLEHIIGKPIISFCYPGGDYGSQHPALVEHAGYRLARTVQRFQTHFFDPFQLPTTIHAYRHWSDAIKILKVANYRPLHTLRLLLNWDDLAIELFDKTVAEGGIFHLWGHSWEIDKHSDWKRLERVFSAISGKNNVLYTTNAELL